MKRLLFVAVLLGAVPVFAHHQFASEFDVEKPVTLKGKIVKFQWVNPHSWLYIDVTEPDGTVASWALEFGAPSGLIKRGWRKTDLPVGAVVTVDGFLAKNGTKTANATKVLLPDGKSLFAGSSAGDAN